MEGPLVPIVVFLAVYVALTFELVNKAVAALLGVMILLVLHVVSEHKRLSSSISRPSCCCWA
jgi:Na+/H+ antiporter NhaD/arsenite permease-like protein